MYGYNIIFQQAQRIKTNHSFIKKPFLVPFVSTCYPNIEMT